MGVLRGGGGGRGRTVRGGGGEREVARGTKGRGDEESVTSLAMRAMAERSVLNRGVRGEEREAPFHDTHKGKRCSQFSTHPTN